MNPFYNESGFMFSFLNSLVLPALAAIVIPIIIHFFNRRKTKKIQFSSLRFLKMLENQRIRQVRLLQILLILIRTLFILFIVLAFARPALKSALTSSASARTTAVLILDDSYSMQAFTGSISRFQAERDQMVKIIKTFNPDDRVFILPLSDIPANLNPINLNQPPMDLIKKFSVTNGSPQITNAFKAANKIFNDYPNYNRELYILSDFKINRSSMPDSVENALTNRKINCLLIGSGQNDQNNIGIDTVIVENQLFEVNKPVQFTIELKNYNTDNAAETLVNLYRNNERLAMQQASLNPGETKPVHLVFVPKSTGQVLLQFEIDDDNLLIDNHYYLNFNIPEQVNILFVADQIPLTLKAALDVINTNSVLKINKFDFGQWVGKNLEDYDLIVLYNPPQINPESVRRLNNYLLNSNLLIFPGLNLSVREFNLMFNQLTGRNLIINLNTSPGNDTYFALDPNITSLPLFKPIFIEENNQIELPKILKYFKLAKMGKTIIKLQNNDPLLAEYQSQSNNKVMVFTTLPEDDWNDLSTKGFFIPMLYRILFTASQSSRAEKTYLVNDPVAISLPDLSLSEKYTVTGPNSESYEIIPQQSAMGLQVHIDKLLVPGHYIIRKNNLISQVISVNISSNELKPPYINFANLSDNVISVNPNADLGEVIKSARIGQELWYVFLSLALLMLLLEVLLIKRIEGRGLK